jgi:colanic acid biosynthesis glycosyl transferase WcaI
VAHDLADKEIVLYSGTIGLKHDPDQLLDLAEALRARPAARVVVVSEGLFATRLARSAAERSLSNLVVLPFLPFEVYPDALGAADVLVALLDADAGRFSVPSKVLSYLCAGRAIVLSAPAENLASRTVQRAGAGIVVPAGDSGAFIQAVTRILENAALKTKFAEAGYNYARATFDIRSIGDRFETIFADVRGRVNA